MPRGDLPGWRQVFVDDFTAEAPLGSFQRVYGDRWTGYEGLRDTSRAGLYSESRVVSVRNGLLDMHLRTVDGQPLVAAPVPLVTGQPWRGTRYGRFSVRFRSDPVPGYKIAWLLWPDSDDWSDGEIDFPEGELDGTVTWANKLGASERFDKGDTGTPVAGSWHVATVEWTPDGVTAYLDGRRVGRSDHAPTSAFHWVLQAETAYERPPASSDGHVQVDWVAAWARSS